MSVFKHYFLKKFYDPVPREKNDTVHLVIKI